MLHGRYVHLKKAKPIHKGQYHSLVRKDVSRDYNRKGSVAKKESDHDLKELGAKTN
jgi:hypothetical protein